MRAQERTREREREREKGDLSGGLGKRKVQMVCTRTEHSNVRRRQVEGITIRTNSVYLLAFLQW